MEKKLDMIGQKFGRLTVVSRAENDKYNNSRWNCVCDCGEMITTNRQSLRRGSTSSCGCLRKELRSKANTTHGMSKSPSNLTWIDMRQRCTNPNDSAYKNYGGRGITICERWDKFENFYADMGERPDGMSIERIDNNGNYCPENCSWDNRKNQNRNTRSNVMIRHNGKEQCLKAWSEELGINYYTLRGRLKKRTPQVAFNMGFGRWPTTSSTIKNDK